MLKAVFLSMKRNTKNCRTKTLVCNPNTLVRVFKYLTFRDKSYSNSTSYFIISGLVLSCL